MVSEFNFNDDINEPVKKFGLCKKSTECYACTERVIIDFELLVIEEAPNSFITEDEIVKFCPDCLIKMNIPVMLYNSRDVILWDVYKVTELEGCQAAFHPDTIN